MGARGVPAQVAHLAAAVAAAPALALSGCGADDEPKALRGEEREIAQVLVVLTQAAQRGDFRTVCRDLFTASARRRAGGRDCQELLRSTAGDVRRPRLQLLGIEVEGRRAEARVRAVALGQPPVVDRIRFTREGAEWRIDSLAS